MDPTALPTDNLYKFAALSGVALVGFLMWLTWRTQQELQAALLAITVKGGKSAVAVRRLEDLEKLANLKQTQLKERLAKLDSQARAGGGTEADLDRAKALEAELKDFEKSGPARLEEQHKVREAQAILAAVVGDLGLRVQVFRKQRRRYTIATFAALAWSIAGFGLWYIKLQMPLDAKLKLEAEVATIELQIKKATLEASRHAGAPPTPVQKQ